MAKKEKPTKKKKTKSGLRSFRLSHRAERPQLPKLVPMRKLLKETLRLLKTEWQLFGGLALIYLVTYRILVDGLARVDLTAFKEILGSQEAVSNRVIELSALTSAAFSFNAETGTPQGGLYASLLTILFALAVIWTARQRLAGRGAKIRDALYNAPTPFIPVLVLLLVIFLQTLPMAVGLFLFGAAKISGVAVNGVENLMLFVMVVLSTLLTSYWLSSSIIALMAVTLPGMYPLAALRGAKKLVNFRRWQIFLRVMIFALVLALCWLVVIVLTVSNRVTLMITTEVVDVLRAATLVVGTLYLYKLYRSLVDEKA